MICDKASGQGGGDGGVGGVGGGGVVGGGKPPKPIVTPPSLQTQI